MRALARVTLAATALLGAASAALGADAPALPERFTILIGFAPGQGNDQAAMPDASSTVAGRIAAEMTFDQSARFLARHLARLLPAQPYGQPRGEVRYAPGAAGFVAAAMLAGAKPDGSVLGLLSSNTIMASALGGAGGRFNARSLVWIGGLAPDVWTCVRRAGAPKPGQLREGQLWAGSLGAGSRGDIHARALAEYAGLKLRPLTGYTGLFELARSLENSEIDAACGWPLRDIQTRHGDWLREGRMEIFAQFSGVSQGLSPGLSQGLGEAPHARDLAMGDHARALLGALESESLLAWPLAAPPGLPPALAAIWRKAFAELIADTDALEDAARTGVALDPVSAQVVGETVKALHGLAPEVKMGLAGLARR